MKARDVISYFGLICTCTTTRVDPDTLPSIEVLIVPPVKPFPQVSEEIRRIRQKREGEESALNLKIKLAYTQSRATMIQEISGILQQYTSTRSSFLESGHNIENLAINVHPVADIGPQVKNVIKEIDEKRGSEEKAQVEQGIGELSKVRSLIKQTVQKSMRESFGNAQKGKQQKMKRPSFLEEERFGIKPVLNVRVGSSSIGDGLNDGSSYPSVVDMVEDENESRNSAEMTLLNSLLYFTRQLGYDCTNFLRSSLQPARVSAQPSSFIGPAQGVASDPSIMMTKLVKQMLRFLPPGVPRIWRKRAFRHSTVQLDIYPPESDSRLDAEMLRAMLKSERDLRKARLKAYVKVKRRLLKDIVFEIKATIEQLANSRIKT